MLEFGGRKSGSGIDIRRNAKLRREREDLLDLSNVPSQGGKRLARRVCEREARCYVACC